jgi:pimeloyl-ACP methyl ester carboxylesterase
MSIKEKFPNIKSLPSTLSAVNAAANAVNAAATAVGRVATGSYTSNERFEETCIGPIEKKSMEYQGPLRNPIIVVHGFLGANLVNARTGVNVWGEFKGQDVLNLSEERMRSLALPMRPGVGLNDLSDDVLPDGLLDTVKVKFFNFTYKQQAYVNLMNILKEGGYHPEGAPPEGGKNYATLFGFAYDWRRDLQWNAAKLHAFILEKREYMRDQYEIMYGIKDYDVRFDLMAHSMGGLVSRYFLMYGTADLPPDNVEPVVTWAGAEHVNRVFLLGTPNAGYVDTLLELRNGTEIPPCPAALLGTWPAYYQMLPVPSRRSVVYSDAPEKALDLFDIDVWRKMKWGLADPNQADTLAMLMPDVASKSERFETAVEHLDKCLKRAKRFIEVMGVKAVPPENLGMYLVLGNAVKTTRRLLANPSTGALKILDYAPGDGKVTKSSALFDERDGQTWTPFFHGPIKWDNIIQLRAAHMGITVDPAFKDNILFFLTTLPNYSRQFHQAR